MLFFCSLYVLIFYIIIFICFKKILNFFFAFFHCLSFLMFVFVWFIKLINYCTVVRLDTWHTFNFKSSLELVLCPIQLFVVEYVPCIGKWGHGVGTMGDAGRISIKTHFVQSVMLWSTLYTDLNVKNYFKKKMFIGQLLDVL